jgi:hypothetical protein
MALFAGSSFLYISSSRQIVSNFSKNLDRLITELHSIRAEDIGSRVDRLMP